MSTLPTIRSMSIGAMIAALALISAAALSGENQPFGRSSVSATSATSGTAASTAVAALRDGRSSLYASDVRDAAREVRFASRSPGFRGNGRGSVYVWQIQQRHDGVAAFERPGSGDR